MEDLFFQDIILKHLNSPEDDSLTQQVNEIRSLSGENELYFQEIKKIWDASAETVRLRIIDQEAAVRNFRNKLGDHTEQFYRGSSFSWIRNIAAVLFIFILGFWVYVKKTEVNYIVKETKSQIDSVLLNDGTRVILANNSSISYPEKFLGRKREISLVKGQAFFKVHRDTSRPFSVLIRKSRVTVLGTSFNINYSAAEINLAVKTGKVMFSPNQKSESSILLAGQAVSYNFIRNEMTIKNGANASSWLTKELKFVDMPLDEVCNQISEYYKIKITLYDKMHTVKKFNASFKNSSLENVLAVLKETYHIEVIRENNIITIKTI